MLDQQVQSVSESRGQEFPVEVVMNEGEMLKAKRAVLNLDYASQGLLNELGMVVEE